jgi:hypothetical protein
VSARSETDRNGNVELWQASARGSLAQNAYESNIYDELVHPIRYMEEQGEQGGGGIDDCGEMLPEWQWAWLGAYLT